MRAMILAAGRGERMRPLTDSIPKPLLKIGGKALIDYQLEALVGAGVDKVVINIGHLGEQVRNHVGNGDTFGLNVLFSDEGNELLETAGGIIKALPLLGDAPFIVTNADIFTEFDYSSLPQQMTGDAHLVLVPNPRHNPDGDFAIKDGWVVPENEKKLTYSGIGLYQPRFFSDCPQGRSALAPLLHQAVQDRVLTAQFFDGQWTDVGTPKRLEELNKSIA